MFLEGKKRGERKINVLGNFERTSIKEILLVVSGDDWKDQEMLVFRVVVDLRTCKNQLRFIGLVSSYNLDRK